MLLCALAVNIRSLRSQHLSRKKECIIKIDLRVQPSQIFQIIRCIQVHSQARKLCHLQAHIRAQRFLAVRVEGISPESIAQRTERVNDQRIRPAAVPVGAITTTGGCTASASSSWISATLMSGRSAGTASTLCTAKLRAIWVALLSAVFKPEWPPSCSVHALSRVPTPAPADHG